MIISLLASLLTGLMLVACDDSKTPVVSRASTVLSTQYVSPCSGNLNSQSQVDGNNNITPVIGDPARLEKPTPTPGQSGLKTVPAIVKTATGQTVNMKLELACTSQQQETGLMNRTSLPEETGMLFVFEQKVRIGFWMRNTLIPLSIAWIDDKGVILEIQDMEANSDDTHTPQKEYIWALEVPKGYYAKKNIKAGDTITITQP